MSFQTLQNFSQQVDFHVIPFLRAWVRQEKIRCTLPTTDVRRGVHNIKYSTGIRI
jgi:hypothetical protein